MSKRYGWLQQRILAALERDDKLHTTFDLAAVAFRIEPDSQGRILLEQTHITSTHRALKKLADEGEIQFLGFGHRKRALWASRAYKAPEPDPKVVAHEKAIAEAAESVGRMILHAFKQMLWK